jgi:hypothetical protein
MDQYDKQAHLLWMLIGRGRNVLMNDHLDEIAAALRTAAQDAAAAERARLIEAIRDQIEIVNDDGDLRMVDALVAIHDTYDAAQATPDAAGPAGGE